MDYPVITNKMHSERHKVSLYLITKKRQAQRATGHSYTNELPLLFSCISGPNYLVYINVVLKTRICYILTISSTSSIWILTHWHITSQIKPSYCACVDVQVVAPHWWQLDIWFMQHPAYWVMILVLGGHQFWRSVIRSAIKMVLITRYHIKKHQDVLRK
jgi:hypothetical protein